jgi:hypothetical protein
MWGARGPFLPAAAMVVAVVTPVVFCAIATEKCKKNTKISCLIEFRDVRWNILAFNFWLSDYHMQVFYFFVSHLHI